MNDNMKKDQGNPGQSDSQHGQPQQTHEDASKKNPVQDRNREQDNKEKPQDQGGQRRAS